MPDPAIEAAQRAFRLWRDVRPRRSAEVITVSAAREALAPLRELHVKTYYDGCNWCSHCTDMVDEGDLFMRPWPCDTAKLIYPSEEL